MGAPGGNRKAMGPRAPIVTTRGNELRRAKVSILCAGTQEWKKAQISRIFAIVNQFPPIETDRTLPRTVKPSGSLGETSSMPYGARVHRLVLKAVLLRGCSCGESLQTSRENLLRTCLIYEDHRYMLREASHEVSLPKSWAPRMESKHYVSKFLLKSGTFPREECARHHSPRFQRSQNHQTARRMMST